MFDLLDAVRYSVTVIRMVPATRVTEPVVVELGVPVMTTSPAVMPLTSPVSRPTVTRAGSDETQTVIALARDLTGRRSREHGAIGIVETDRRDRPSSPTRSCEGP